MEIRKWLMSELYKRGFYQCKRMTTNDMLTLLKELERSDRLIYESSKSSVDRDHPSDKWF